MFVIYQRSVMKRARLMLEENMLPNDNTPIKCLR